MKSRANKEHKRLYDKEYNEKNKELKRAKAKIYREKNKESLKIRKANEYHKNKERYRQTWHRNVLKYRFGITVEQYEKILANQNGVCKICKQFRLSKHQKRMCVDHCHSTGKIRGILCDNCNYAISRFNDDTNILESAIQYLKTNGDDIEIGATIDMSVYSPKSRGVKKRMNRFINHSCYAAYINLEHRDDRRTHMIGELAKAGISATRIRGILPHTVDGDLSKYQTMLQRTPGALGCHLAQCEIMKEALDRRKNAFVMEDDLVFCSDIQDRFDYIEDFLSKNEWDVFFLGGTYHVSVGNSPTWWHKLGHSPDLPDCKCTLGVDVEKTDDPKIVRTYGAFSTHAYIVNKNSIEKILKYFDENVHLSMGIDWLFIKMQPELKAFAFVPGCVKQLDNQSDIGNGMTIFSGFAMLGEHWWKDKMEDFNYDNFVV